MSRPIRCRKAFTLLEVLISVTLCSVLTTVCVVAFFRVGALIHRAQWRLATHEHAQTLYAAVDHSLSVLAQHCALVLSCTSATPGVPALPGQNAVTATGTVTLTFMHGKESNEDWDWQSQGNPDNADLVWETWTWRQSDQTLRMASSTPRRTFQLTQSFSPTPGGAEYYLSTFSYLPQPRRVLDPVHPEWTLNDNILFPVNPSQPTASRAGAGDYGDAQDLTNRLGTVLTHVSALSWQLVAMDGTVTTCDDTTTATVVRDGVWMDGRLTADLAAPVSSAVVAGSELAARPRLMRLRYTVTDPHSARSETISLSFAMPGFAATP